MPVRVGAADAGGIRSHPARRASYGLGADGRWTGLVRDPVARMMHRHLSIVAGRSWRSARSSACPRCSLSCTWAGEPSGCSCLRPEPDTSPYPSVSESAVNLLVIAGRAIGAAFNLAGTAMQFIITAFTVISLLLLLLAIVLLATGRGLTAHAGWARAVALLFSLVLLLASTLGG